MQTINFWQRRRLRAARRFVEAMAMAGIVGIAISVLLPLLGVGRIELLRGLDFAELGRSPHDVGPDWLVAWFSLIPNAVIVYGLCQLVLMARGGPAALPVSHRHGRYFFRFAVSLLLAEIVQLMMPLLEVGSLRALGMTFHGTIAFWLDGENIGILFVAALLVLVAWMLDAASAYVEDSQSIV
jgi:hypothetical protein